MKKKLVGAFASFVASALIAGPVNNPASSAQFESGLFTGAQQDYTVRVGYVSDMVANRKVEDKVTKAHIDRTEITRNGLSLTLGLFDRFDIFAATGKASFSTHATMKGTNDFPMVTTNVDHGTFWNVGARGILWTMDNTSINAFADYGHLRGRVSAVTHQAVSSRHTSTLLRGTEWKLGVGVSHTIQVSPDMSVVPALSVRYSDGHFKYRGSQVVSVNSTSVTLNNLKARGHFGVGLSCGLFAGKMFGLNLEGRFFDEDAASLTAEIRI